jgi:hypothetical protein
VTAIILVFVVFAIIRGNERRQKAKLAAVVAAQAAAAKWEAMTPEQPTASVAAANQAHAAAKLAAEKRRARNWSTVKWTVGFLTVAAIFIVVVTLLDGWHFVAVAALIGFAAMCVYELISSAVADGIRRGRQ